MIHGRRLFVDEISAIQKKRSIKGFLAKIDKTINEIQESKTAKYSFNFESGIPEITTTVIN